MLIVLAIILLTGVIIKAYLKVKRGMKFELININIEFFLSIECVIIGKQVGLQLTTTYVIGRQTTVFISSNRLQDILMNEGFFSVCFSFMNFNN